MMEASLKKGTAAAYHELPDITRQPDARFTTLTHQQIELSLPRTICRAMMAGFAASTYAFQQSSSPDRG